MTENQQWRGADESSGSSWFDNAADDEGFGEIDALVYAEDDESPEMRYQRERESMADLKGPDIDSIEVPVMKTESASEPWRPGGETAVPKPKGPKKANPFLAVAVAVLPIALFGAIVWFVMGLYGFR